MCTDSIKIVIRLATNDDRENVLYGLREFFVKYEPMSIGHRIKAPIKTQEVYFMKAFEKGYTLIAELDDDSRTFAGFLVNVPYTLELKKERQQQVITDEKLLDIRGLMDALSNQYDIFGKHNITEYFCLAVLGTKPELCNKSIAEKLFERGIQLAKENGFKLVNAACTGFYSQRIATKLGMDCVASVDYADFKNENGEQIFNPPAPHTSIKNFIKLL